MLVVLIALLASALGLTAEATGIRTMRHVRHQRCLTNTARLERELGIGPYGIAARVLSSERQDDLDEAIRSAQWQQTAAITAENPLTKREIAAQRKESVRIAKHAMGREYHGR